MLPNFLHPCMQPTVRCNVICADDHAAQNLLAAPLTAAHTSGFVAYAVVRPPVHLDFQLACVIELHSVAVWTRVGSMCTTGLEVCVRNSSASSFVQIGQAFEWPSEKEGVLFVNATFEVDGDADDTATHALHHCAFSRSLGQRMAVRQVRISIKRTLLRSVPALKMVRITGRPAAWCLSAAACQIQLDRWAGRLPTFGFYGSSSSSSSGNEVPTSTSASPMALLPALPSTTSSSSSSASSSSSSSASSSSSSSASSSSSFYSTVPANAVRHHDFATPTAIPDDFLDAITCEIMSLPMTLPCGKCVDRTTLERHQNTLASSWGRQPCDPFTGLPFTPVRRPLLNAALKAQIDRFLLQHQHRSDLRAVPRTVGTVSAATSATTVAAPPPKRRADAADHAAEPVTKFSRGAAGQQPQAGQTVASGSAGCGDCGGNLVLYSLRTCTHLICRQCLLLAKRQCSQCERPFTHADVVRLHDKPIV